MCPEEHCLCSRGKRRHHRCIALPSHNCGLFGGGVCVVSLPAGVTEVSPQVATLSSHLASPSVQDQLDSMDLSSLPLEVQTEVKSTRARHSSVFSSHERDVGCTKLIAHDTSSPLYFIDQHNKKSQ